MKIYDLVKQLLEENKEYRSSDRKLIWAVWDWQRLLYGGVISKTSFMDKAMMPDTITRARRKVQEKFEELKADEVVEKFREEKEAEKGTHVYREEIQPIQDTLL